MFATDNKMMRLKFILPVLFFNLSLLAVGNQCLDGSPKNQKFKRILESSNYFLVKEFRNKGLFKIQEGGIGCKDCSTTAQRLGLPEKLTEIPKECIQASLKRKVAQTSIECTRTPEGNWTYTPHSSRSTSTPCIDDSSVDYIHFVTNKVISCFQGLSMQNGVKEAIDPKVLYSKLNNESSFNFTYSYGGGVGAGQLTGWAVQEMNVLDPSRTKGKEVKGNGRFILDEILKSSNPECAGLKPVIENDLKFKYHSPRKINCEWVSMENGLARNLIYSIGYFSFLKHQVIGKELKRRAPSAYNDPELLNLLTLVGYGPKGANRALTLIRTLRIGAPPYSNEYFKKQLRNEVYLKNTAAKMAEVKKIAGGSCRLL